MLFRSLAERGVKELNIIAQDTTRFGEDKYGKPMLAELLIDFVLSLSMPYSAGVFFLVMKLKGRLPIKRL